MKNNHPEEPDKKIISIIQSIYKKLLPKFIRYFLWRLRKCVIGIFSGKCKARKLLKFEIHLTEHCNLNCASCNHFSPLAEEQYLDITSYKKDCERIAKLTGGRIEQIRLMGGEPLLHPQLVEIIKTSRNFFNCATPIEIVTNGILLPAQSHEFWQACKENNIGINISKYPINLNIEKIEKLTKEYCIELIYTNNVDKSGSWRIEPFDVSGSQNIKTNFLICYNGNNCIQLKDGKLFTCQHTAYINHFNNYFHTNFEITERDYISIYENHTMKKILQYLAKPIPFCRYCIQGDKSYSQPNRTWKISHKDISEWT